MAEFPLEHIVDNPTNDDDDDNNDQYVSEKGIIRNFRIFIELLDIMGQNW